MFYSIAANILLTKDGVCKLADFGLAMKMEEGGLYAGAGSPYWMSPEILDGSGSRFV
jgi:serine/threonine protein kinase